MHVTYLDGLDQHKTRDQLLITRPMLNCIYWCHRLRSLWACQASSIAYFEGCFYPNELFTMQAHKNVWPVKSLDTTAQPKHFETSIFWTPLDCPDKIHTRVPYYTVCCTVQFCNIKSLILLIFYTTTTSFNPLVASSNLARPTNTKTKSPTHKVGLFVFVRFTRKNYRWSFVCSLICIICSSLKLEALSMQDSSNSFIAALLIAPAPRNVAADSWIDSKIAFLNFLLLLKKTT